MDQAGHWETVLKDVFCLLLLCYEVSYFAGVPDLLRDGWPGLTFKVVQLADHVPCPMNPCATPYQLMDHNSSST